MKQKMQTYPELQEYMLFKQVKLLMLIKFQESKFKCSSDKPFR